MSDTLPPLTKAAFDGEKHAVDTRDFVRCNHAKCELISPVEVKCPCGAYWKHTRAREIFEHFTNQ